MALVHRRLYRADQVELVADQLAQLVDEGVPHVSRPNEQQPAAPVFATRGVDPKLSVGIHAAAAAGEFGNAP